nr:ABC transporter ATP-binding protein [Sphingobium phenoxybenzoativorans]
MIELQNISKIYPINGGVRTIFSNVNLKISKGERIGVLGRNGAGKSTLVRLIGGAEKPSGGTIRRSMSVSWPLAFSGGFQPRLTGADNLRFICRIYNVDYSERLSYVQDFSELGVYLNEPVANYSSGMRARLAFAISMTIDFDCYLIDEVTAVGDASFREKCKVELFQKRRDRAMVIVSHSEGYIKENCNRFLLLRDKNLIEFASYREAYHHHKAMMMMPPPPGE